MKKKQNRNRLLSLVLSMVMILQMLPLSVFAADETSGTCGPNLTWRIDGDTLYIDGEGPMYDYGYEYDDEGNLVVDDEGHVVENPTPWYKGDYTRIELDDRITHIGKAAFGREEIDNYYSGFSLESIELPSKLESIGDYAFCTIFGVEEIVLPEGLTEMGVGAFANCEDLKSVTIPSTLKVIPDHAFEMCFQLENVTIAEGVEEIGVAAFMQCNDSWNATNYENFAAIPGIKHLEIPGSVKLIYPNAFGGDVTLTELVLNEGLEAIGPWAFSGCNYLRSVTIPSTVKEISDEAFCSWGADMYLGDNSFMDKVPNGPMNLDVLSKNLSLYVPLPDWAEEDYEPELWMNPQAVINAYPDSKIAQEIEAYNAGLSEDEVENWITFYPITDDDHLFSDWTSQDLYYHSRTCADCGLEEEQYHTLVIDMYNYTIMTCGVDEQYRWICTECDFVSEFFTDPEWTSDGHDLVPDYDQYADYHTTWCRKCYEDIQLPHEWSYIPDPEATEPYEVEALCTVCMYERVITVIPAGSTIITVRAQDENGDAATLPEGSYTIRWEDSDGNTLAEGNTYTHAESWDVTEENPVIAVISFNDELREAYSVGAEVRHTVTALGTETEYLLTARAPLTVKGKLQVEGLTSLPVNDVTLTLTTTVAGVETEQTIEVDRSGVFTVQIRRAPTKLDFRCTGYSGITLDNIQMMPAVDGVIDLGTITLTDTMVSEYMTITYTDAEQMALAKQLAESEAVLTAVNERTGEEYHGVRVCPVSVKDQPASGYRFWVTFGSDMDQHFQTGDSVTIRCSQTDSVRTESVKFDPYTFTIARGGEQSELALSLYRTPRLDIGLNCMANIYLFDSEGRIVFSGFDREYHRLLERGTYTLVCFRKNDTIPTIDSPEMFEHFDLPTDIYVKETFTITEDMTLEYQVPYFFAGSKVGVAVQCDLDRMENGLVPMQVLFNENFVDAYAEDEAIRITFEGSVSDLPIEPVGGTYAFGEQALGLEEEADETTLTVTTHRPNGAFTVYVKPTGEFIHVIAEGSSGSRDYLCFQLPSISVEVHNLAGTRSNPNGYFWLYAKLSEDIAPYTAQLYVNNELQSETVLNIKGEGKNVIPLPLKAYGDGDSTHNAVVHVVDKDGELVWTSRNQMVTLTRDAILYTAPSKLAIRVNWSGGHAGSQIIRKTIDLQNNPGGYLNVYVYQPQMNPDGTLKTDTVFDYALKMEDNSMIKNGVVSMRVFCNEDASEPTIHTVALKYNELSDSFEGTLTLKANTYTVRDLPYGYSFDYTTTRPGSSAAPERPPFSTEQLVDTLEAQAEQREQWASDMASNVFEFYDPDDVEFTLENTEGLTDEEKEMFRVLLSISNDLYTLREEAEQSYASIAADRYGEDVLSDSPVQSVQKITDSVSDQFDCETIPEGSTSADALLEAGYEEINTSYGDFHLNIDESGAASLVDLQNNLSTSVSVDYTGQDLETAIATYAPTFFSAVHAMLDASIDATEKVSNYYSNLLIRKLGLEGNIDQLDDMIAKYKTYLGLLEDPITWKSGDYGKDLKTISLEIAEELDEIDLTRQQIEQFKRTLKSLKADLAQTEKSIRLKSLERPNLNKNLQQLRFLNSGAGKVVSIVGLDFYGIVVSVIGVVDAIDVARDRENTIEGAQDRADRTLAFSNAAAKCTGMTPPDGCEDAYEEYIAEGEDAKDWNTAWFCTKVGQAVGSVASVGVGLFLKGAPGIIASLGIGIVGGGAELICLEGFNDSLDDMQEIWLEVETNCVKEYELSEEEQECVAEEMGRGSEEEDGESGAGNLPDGNGNNKEEPAYPIGTKTFIDPAGYVYEAVASNRIEGATAKIYYEGESGEEIYWAEADLYGEVNPQITNDEGRFAWMTPIGNWLVKITKDGYENADSKNDPAAVAGWLPVPPPQLDVNIALVSEAAPEVISAAVAADQAQVVFSQYMEVSQFANGNLVTVTQDSEPVPVTAVFTDAEVSPTDDAVTYGRVLKLTRTDGQPFSGSGIEIGIDAEAQNYAGNAMESAYTSGALTAAQIAGSLNHSYPNRYVTDISQSEEIVVQVLDTAGQPMAGVTVTARQKVGGTLEMGESAVSDASGRAVFTVKGISSGYDAVIFEAGVVRTEMNTRVSPLGSTAPQKPTANLSDYAAVEEGTQLILTYPGTEDVVIYYTTNNTCPCTDSAGRKVYTDPITITEDTYFRIAAWTQTGGYSERLNLHITVKAEDVHICKDHLTRVEAKPADCTVDGNVEYYECACGKWYSDATASVEITDKDSVVIKADHEYGTLIAEVPALHTATELKPGMAAHYFCDKCDTYFTAEKVETTEAALVIPAPVHDYATVNGYKEVDGHADTCSCGAHDTVVGHTPDIPAATETEDQKCSVCGYVMATATGHIHTNHLTRVEAKSADCTVDGNIEYWSCSCGKYFADAAASVEIADKASVVVKASHDYGILVDEVPAVHTATELKAGMKAHYFCDECDTYFTAEKVQTTEAALIIPAPVHDYATVNGYKEVDGHADTCSCGAHNAVVEHTPDIPAATETRDQKCSVCGYVMATATGHIHTNHLTRVEAKSADCTVDGNIEYWSCSCGKYFEDATASVEITDKDSVVIKADHEYGTLIAEVPALHTATELKPGMAAHYFCDECDTYFTAEKVETTEDALVIPTPVHDYKTVNGYKEADGHADTCSCGAHNTVVGHTPDIPAATETQDQKCSVCGYVMATATGHIHKDHLTRVEAKPAGCTVDGNIEYWSCSCGKYFADAAASVEITDKASVVVKASHDYGILVDEVPAVHTATELKAGMKAHYFCDECDTYFTAEKVQTTEAALIIPAPTHNYATVNGYKEADGHADTCSCGAHDTVVGHTPDIPTVTETEDQKCSVCGYVMATATGHIHTNHLTRVEAKSADCTVDGNVEYYECACGKYFADAAASVEITDKASVVVKASHDYGILVDEVPAVHTATELKAGMKAHYFCDKCDTYFTAEKVQTTEAALIIPAPTHNYANVNGYKEADGHADTCSCGAHDTVVGHTPDIPTATETEDQKCSVCGYVMATATGKSAYLVTVVGSYASITGGGEYETGKTVTVYAGSRSGYSFNGWTSSDVTITYANNATASFVMPDHAVTVTANWTKNSSGGGGSYVPVSYTNTVAATKNGDVSVSPKSAVKGETVTVTIVPDKGYTLEILTVTDKNGKEIELTNMGDGKYTFKMPASKITVTVTFMDDNTMLNFFVDVSADAYYYDAVLWAVEEGITSGTSATTFSPDNPCTRAQMATFLWRAAGSPEPVGRDFPFVDVDADTYYAKAVQWAYEQGITGGTSATTFSPDQTCTRGQMATFLYRVADGKPVSNTVIFTDIEADKYYAKAVQWAYEQKITVGTSATTFSPDDPCTRAQMVTFLCRCFEE